jgi:DNA-binding CsgD family transcriptional regulator
MLVFGTQIHIVTFLFILLEIGMFIFQLAIYLFRPQEKNRMLYLILLFLMLLYNITGGLFPDPKISIPLPTQEMIAYGTGFLMASYFPFYFYKACQLPSLRWHALYGVPLFLILPYIVFFVVVYAINGELNVDIKYGMIVPFIYAMVLLRVLFKAIRKKYEENRNKHKYMEEIAMYCAITPWAALAFFGFVEESQLLEVLCTNTGIICITVLFMSKSIKDARMEYDQLQEFGKNGYLPASFDDNCKNFNLTTREKEIVLLLKKGLTYKEISAVLFISGKTVDNHVQNIYEKTAVTNKVSLIYKLYN